MNRKVFICHSSKDYEKVSLVKEILESLSLQPVVLFHASIGSNEDMDTVIKKNIDSSESYVLCDSTNAKASYWVQAEIKYITSKNVQYETIDLEASDINVEQSAERVGRRILNALVKDSGKNEDDKQEIWVFLSHSNKDYEKVIKVRDLLEKHSFRPLMFFLKCLNDKDEIDDLIKREIDCRGRFILCDSENARKSDWVKREVEYIQSKQRVYQTIDIDAPVEKIAEDVLEFKKKSTVYISYTHNDEGLYTQLASMLRDDWDFAVFDPKQMATGTSFSDTITSTMDNALTSGMIIFVITESFVKSPWCIKELSYVIDRVKLKDEVHNVLLLEDEKLNSDSMSQLVLNDKIPVCKIKILDGKLMIDSRRLYWEFMREQISEGVRRKDPNALFILADHFYWDDDRFDNYNTRGMRVAAAKMAKEAAEKGHPSAQHLYEMIISDYPEIEDEIK